MNATTPFWTLAAALAAALVCLPSAGADADGEAPQCFPVAFDDNGHPSIRWECIPDDAAGPEAEALIGAAAALDPTAGGS